ncbi:hypothetical protein ACJX0J_036980, partial [Zea mays]
KYVNFRITKTMDHVSSLNIISCQFMLIDLPITHFPLIHHPPFFISMAAYNPFVSTLYYPFLSIDIGAGPHHTYGLLSAREICVGYVLGASVQLLH